MSNLTKIQQAALAELPTEIAEKLARISQFSDTAKGIANSLHELFAKLQLPHSVREATLQHYRDHLLGVEHEGDASVAHAMAHLLITMRKEAASGGTVCSDNDVLDAITIVSTIAEILSSPEGSATVATLKAVIAQEEAGNSTIH